MADIKFKMIDNSGSQNEEHEVMNSWLRDAAKGGQPLPESGSVDENRAGDPHRDLTENEGMNQALRAMARR